MKLSELIARDEAALADLLSERAKQTDSIGVLRDTIAAKDSADEADERAVSEALDKRAATDKSIDVLQTQIADRQAEAKRDAEIDALQAAVKPVEVRKPSYDRVVRVGAEERTYAPEKERGFDKSTGQFRGGNGPVAAGGQFVRDVGAAFLGDYDARDRLSRHMAEERVERSEWMSRAAGTGAFAGLTVPQYLTDLFAPAAAAARPFADVCRKLPLPPDGMTVNISRITTATGVALQASENTAVQETNIDDTLLTENVQTAAGQQTLSRQAIDRSTGAEDIVLNDLFRRYNTLVDSTLINQATTGLDAIAQQVAYTDGTPTALELYPKILNAQANLEGVYLDLQVTREFAIMHSRRWAWIQSQVGTSWPFITQPGIPTQAGGVNNATAYSSGVRGTLPNGMSVVVDNNCATNLGAGTEDRVYIVNADECFLWEDPSAPVFIRAEQPAAASLGVLLVVYGYFAYTHRRYTNGQQLVQGTGLIAPTF